MDRFGLFVSFESLRTNGNSGPGKKARAASAGELVLRVWYGGAEAEKNRVLSY